jgi:hypothetical protein
MFPWIAMREAINTNLYTRTVHPVLEAVNPFQIDFRHPDAHGKSVAYRLHLSMRHQESSLEPGQAIFGAQTEVAPSIRCRPINPLPHHLRQKANLLLGDHIRRHQVADIAQGAQQGATSQGMLVDLQAAPFLPGTGPAGASNAQVSMLKGMRAARNLRSDQAMRRSMRCHHRYPTHAAASRYGIAPGTHMIRPASC